MPMSAKEHERKPKNGGAAGMATAASRAYSSNADTDHRLLDVEASTFGDDDGLEIYSDAPHALASGDGGAGGVLTAEMEAMVIECLPLVKYIAHRIADRTPKSVEVDDLIGDGIMGLMDAAGHFDPTRGVKFRTYAEQRIRGAILDSLRNLDWVPRSLRQKQRDIEEAIHTISMRNGRAAEDEEVASHLGIPLAELHKSLDDLKGVALGSFEDASGEGEGILAFIADPDAEDPHLVLHKEEMKALLAKLVDDLPEKEKLVVQMYYVEELNMKEIGSALGITESRVSQLHSKAVMRLRTKMRRTMAA